MWIKAYVLPVLLGIIFISKFKNVIGLDISVSMQNWS